MRNIFLLSALVCIILTLSCKKETINHSPQKCNNFVIKFGGTNIEFDWSDAFDEDNDKLTYDLLILFENNKTPSIINSNNIESKHVTTFLQNETIVAMIIIAKDGKGGESTSIEVPTIIL